MSKVFLIKHLICLFLFLFINTAIKAKQIEQWKPLGEGIDFAKFTAKKASFLGDSKISILRVDPNKWELVLIAASQNKDFKNLTAKEWSKEQGLVAAINAGMFGQDYSTHVGYMGNKKHKNNSRINKYQSLAVFDPKVSKKLAPFKIYDLDSKEINIKSILKNYSSAVQNLRLIKKPGENRWSKQAKRWSEAALGEDKQGRVLFIYTRSPFSMHDLNNELLNLDIDLVAAQHLEGGPEAQLYIDVPGMEAEMFGSFETSFKENDDNSSAWPIPNIIGVRAKQ